MERTYKVNIGNDYAIARLVNGPWHGKYIWWLTDIEVPENHRRQGIGNWLMHQICKDADNEKVTLGLQISGYGTMSDDNLARWYTDHGFAIEPNTINVWIRNAQEQDASSPGMDRSTFSGGKLKELEDTHATPECRPQCHP